MFEHTTECDNAYQTYKKCICHVAQAKMLIDALDAIAKLNPPDNTFRKDWEPYQYFERAKNIAKATLENIKDAHL